MQIISLYDNLSTWSYYNTLDNSYKSYIPREAHDAELDRHCTFVKTFRHDKAVVDVNPFLVI